MVCYIHSFVENSELQIVLELADAGDLAQLLRHCQRQQRLLSEQTIWRYFTQLSSALEHMHSRNVMHRGRLIHMALCILMATVHFHLRYQASKCFYNSKRCA